MKTLFFLHEPWERDFIEKQTALSEKSELAFVNGLLDADHLPENRDADIISIFVDSHLDAHVIEAFPHLKLIAARSTGYDHIDAEAVKKRGILVSTVPSYGEHTVAEYAFALLLALSRKVYHAYDRIRETGSFSQEGLRGFDLNGKTIGVVGTGRIGKNVIRIANGFGMRVLASDAYPDEAFAKEVGCEYVDLSQLLGESDVVTLHVPYLESTHHLINKETIRQMKKGAYLINDSRGAVVDTEALVAALREGHVGGAALDVLEEEGAIKDEATFLVSGHPAEANLRTVLANHILIDMPNVIITPHNAFNTIEALQRILQTSVENIAAFVAGKPENIAKL